MRMPVSHVRVWVTVVLVLAGAFRNDLVSMPCIYARAERLWVLVVIIQKERTALAGRL